MDEGPNRGCNCELCNPNWYLGRDGDFVPQPAEQKARQAAEDEAWLRHKAKTEDESFVSVGGLVRLNG